MQAEKENTMRSLINVAIIVIIFTAVVYIAGIADSGRGERDSLRGRINELQEKVAEQREAHFAEKSAIIREQLAKETAEKNIIARQLEAEKARNAQIQIDAESMRGFGVSPLTIVLCAVAVLFMPTIAIIAVVIYLLKTRSKNIVYLTPVNGNGIKEFIPQNQNISLIGVQDEYKQR